METSQETMASSREEDVDMDVEEDVTASRTAVATAEQVPPPPELTAELSHAVFSNHVVSWYLTITKNLYSDLSFIPVFSQFSYYK